MEKMTLFQLTDEMSALEATLEENGGELTPELEEAWSENREQLVAKVDDYGVVLRKFDARVAAIDAEIERLNTMKRVYANSGKAVKEHLKAAMERNGIDKLEGTLTKVSLAKSPVKTEIDEETLLQGLRGKIMSAQQQLPDYVTLVPKVSATKIKESFYGKEYIPAGVTFIDDKKSIRIR